MVDSMGYWFFMFFCSFSNDNYDFWVVDREKIVSNNDRFVTQYICSAANGYFVWLISLDSNFRFQIQYCLYTFCLSFYLNIYTIYYRVLVFIIW